MIHQTYVYVHSTIQLLRPTKETMASFERKLEAFLENYEQMKSVENEEAFLKEFMVGNTALYLPSVRVHCRNVFASPHDTAISLLVCVF